MRNEGLFATAGRPEPDPPPPAAVPLVAMAVGKTKDGESFPAKPGYGEDQSSLPGLIAKMNRSQLRLTQLGETGSARTTSASKSVLSLHDRERDPQVGQDEISSTYLSMTTAGVCEAIVIVVGSI